MSTEQHPTLQPAPAPEVMTPAQRIRADWKALVNRLTYKGIVSNVPYAAFVALLCIVYIANNHRAVETQRELNKDQKILKELNWRRTDIKTRLMNASMETEMIKRGEAQGLKPLLLPAYSILVDSNRAGN